MPRRRKHSSAAERINEFVGADARERKRLQTEGASDAELLRRLLDDYIDELNDKEMEAFSDMAERGRFPLSDKQRGWLERVAARVGAIGAASSENTFSNMDPKKQREQRQHAASVVLPWERPGYRKPMKPPGR